MSDCGPPCRALNDRQHRFHLLCLAGESAAEAYRQTASPKRKTPTKVTCESMGPRMHRSTQVQSAIGFHREHDAKKFSAEKATALKRLRKIAEKGAKSEATAGDAVRAITQESKMLGWNEPERVSFTADAQVELAKEMAELATRAVDDPEAMDQLRALHKKTKGEG